MPDQSECDLGRTDRNDQSLGRWRSTTKRMRVVEQHPWRGRRARLLTIRPSRAVERDMTGIVYCLENPAMPGLVKIGRTQDIEQRLRSLDNTSVPLPFVCVVAMEVDDDTEARATASRCVQRSPRPPQPRVLRGQPERVAAALRLTRGRDVTPESDVVEDEETQIALDKARKKRERFNSKWLASNPEPSFDSTTGTSPTTGSPSLPRWFRRTRSGSMAQETSLSAAATSIMQERGIAWTAQGPLYWHYEGQSLDERRRMEEGVD